MRDLSGVVVIILGVIVVSAIAFAIGQRTTCMSVPFLGTNCHIDTR